MEERIQRYLREEKGIESAVVSQRLMEKVLKYEDIAQEFGRWLETREYEEGGIEIGGYRAKDIYKLNPTLDGIGVFSFLVTLRDEPDMARGMIEEGFKVR